MKSDTLPAVSESNQAAYQEFMALVDVTFPPDSPQRGYADWTARWLLSRRPELQFRTPGAVARLLLNEMFPKADQPGQRAPFQPEGRRRWDPQRREYVEYGPAPARPEYDLAGAIIQFEADASTE